MFDLVGGSLLCFTSNTENQINERTEKMNASWFTSSTNLNLKFIVWYNKNKINK